MTEATYQAIAMIIYFVGMVAIGGWAYGRNHDLDDYMLAGRGLGPWVAALSAGASDMSGWLLMGLPGALYASGLVESWIAIGLTVGAWLNWRYVAPRLRTYTEVARNSITIPSFLDNRLHDDRHLLRWASGIIILVYFTFYVSSGMVAGGVFFENSFGMDYRLGMVLVAAITVVYTLVGGFLAVSYTDFVQGVMMVAALVMVPVVGVVSLGGPAQVIQAVHEVDPSYWAMIGSSVTLVGVVSSLAWATSASRTSSCASWRFGTCQRRGPGGGSASAGCSSRSQAPALPPWSESPTTVATPARWQIPRPSSWRWASSCSTR